MNKCNTGQKIVCDKLISSLKIQKKINFLTYYRLISAHDQQNI